MRVERRVLLAGERIDVAAEDVDDLRDLGGRSMRGPFEHEVLEEMRCAAVLDRFDRRSAAQVIAERHGADVRQGFDEDGEAGRKDDAFDHWRRILWQSSRRAAIARAAASSWLIIASMQRLRRAFSEHGTSAIARSSCGAASANRRCTISATPRPFHAMAFVPSDSSTLVQS